MSFSLNKQLIVGNLGRDPEIIDKGDFRCGVLNVATTESWKDKTTGEWKNLTTWHRVILRGTDVDYAEKNLHKGDSVYVEGVTRHRTWKTGEGQERVTTEVNAQELRLHARAAPRSADAPPAARRSATAPQSQAQPQQQPPQGGDERDDGHANGGYDDGYGDPTQFQF